MNTKIVMTLSAITLGASGIVMTFAPDVLLGFMNTEPSKTALLLVQIIGGLYFAFSMLNWMTKESLIGGIYNRPVAIANFTHFLIAGLAIVKGLNSDRELSLIFWGAGLLYIVFGILFGLILFRHPIKKDGR